MAHDPVWMRGLLAAHIAAGFGSFLLAPVALATAKGGKQHKRWGMVYLWSSMGAVAATALPMSLYRPVLFSHWSRSSASTLLSPGTAF